MLSHKVTASGRPTTQLTEASYPLATMNTNVALIDHLTLIMKMKVKAASEDGQFTSAEIITLTMASVHATEQLFPYLQGTEKKVIATQVITTVVHQLVAEGVLDPNLGAVLEALPVQQIIDAMVILMNKIGGWFKRHWPSIKLWMQTHLCCCCFPGTPPSTKVKSTNSQSTTAPGLNSAELDRINTLLEPISVTSLPLNAHPK